MVTKKTVLILGAGASTHCGYPLGEQLITRLCSLRTENGNLRLPLPERFTNQSTLNFLKRLSRSAHHSIDAFLENSPADEAALGKFLIAQELKKHENIERLFPTEASGWYVDLFDALLVDGLVDFTGSSLGIVTFNYDRSLEAYLHEVIQQRFKKDAAEAASILAGLPIVHVHGILGDYPATPYDKDATPEVLLKLSEKIQIIHEIPHQEGEFCNPMFKEANWMLQSAERIFFLGFGFHLENVQRFRFFTPENTAGKEILTTTMGLHPIRCAQLAEILTPLGLKKDIFRPTALNCKEFFSCTARLE